MDIKKKSYTGWVTQLKIYADWDNRYVSTGTSIYKTKRFDTPYKIRLTIEKIK